MLIASSGFALGLFGLPLVLFPKFVAGLTTIAGGFRSLRGPIDSSLLSLTRDIAILIFGRPERWIATVAYLIFMGGILMLSIRTIRVLRRANPDRMVPILFFCVVYGLLAPRMITYSLSLFLVPTYLLLAWLGWTPAARAVLVASLLPTEQFLYRVVGRGWIEQPGPAFLLPLEYWNLIVLAAVWVLVCQRTWSRMDLRVLGVHVQA